MIKIHKAGDLLPNGEIYLCRLDDEIFTVAPMAPNKMNWYDAMKYAQDLGLELPDLDITQVMFKRKNEGAFKGTYGDDRFLWSLVVRPVRRLTIQAFNDLFNVMSVPDAQGIHQDKPASHRLMNLATASNQSGDVTTSKPDHPENGLDMVALDGAIFNWENVEGPDFGATSINTGILRKFIQAAKAHRNTQTQVLSQVPHHPKEFRND